MRAKRNLIPLVLLLILCNCKTLTPAQRTLWALEVYANQYNLYLEQVINPDMSADKKAALKADPRLIIGDAINPNLTEGQKEALRVKKAILVELKPLVLAAAEYHKTGVLPSKEIQDKMTKLINELLIQGD